MKKTNADWEMAVSEEKASYELKLDYANWLEKRSYRARAELLRLSVELEALRRKRHDPEAPDFTQAERDRQYEIGERLEQLSRRIDSKWIVRIDSRLQIPPGLCELGQIAVTTIRDFLGEKGWKYSGYQTVFISPNEARPTMRLGIGPAVLVINSLDSLLDECAGDSMKGNIFRDELLEELYDVELWREDYDGDYSLIKPLSCPGYSIGLTWTPFSKPENGS